MNLPHILAVDDDQVWLDQIPLILEDHAVVATSLTIDKGMKFLEDHYFDVIILDLNFDGDERTGADVFKEIKTRSNGAHILVISGETNHKKIIDVFNAGATNFLPKPTSNAQIREAIGNILKERERKARVKFLANSDTISLIGSSKAMRAVKDKIDHIIKAQVKDILVTGESGTGKEVVAKYIVSKTGAKNYCPIHCGAISESLAESELFGHQKGAFTGATSDRIGAFEAACGGFVFLDELGEMPLTQQVKLLRVLQERKIKRVGSNTEKPVQFRTIAATNKNLKAMVAKEEFREDLYYRVSKEIIELPPLRERKEDIPELVEFFAKSNHPGKETTFTQEVMILLQKYSWPGNVRELSSIVDRLVARSGGKVIRVADVAVVLPEVATSKGLRARTKDTQLLVDRDRFKKALLATNFDRELAAKKLGISRATYFRRAKELGLVQERRRR